ncbi:hypothetical protein [Afipia birgiae]|uniref:hypothetical protein n=1 Tax=Afipia birgiae TaxID=151414 RepID=UPI0002DB24D1|nr:hypothetical protein [Afipia birgiae]MBX9821200.1 hypothetical protein [Afipia birgiae]
MTDKPVQRPTTTKDNHMPAVEKKNFVPQTGHGVQGNHTPTTSESKPSTPAPSPKKK